MKISKLLDSHHAILRQARLASLAQAFVALRRFAERVRHARLRGRVRLRQPDADEEELWASLTALEGSQAVIEEHFREEELVEFADAVAFLHGTSALDTEFKIEQMAALFVEPLEAELRRSGVEFDRPFDGATHKTRPSIGILPPPIADRQRREPPPQR